MADATPATAARAGDPAGRRTVRFGVFDWLDERPGLELAALYDERLRVLEAADAAGFYCYHLAEHHWTPLSATPSPNLFLAAAAQRTHHIRLGPLVYLLPLYNPLRLIEEICMLDHLSHGRLDVGVGRGASPYELAPFGVEADESRDIFQEALAVILQGLATGAVNYEGRYYTFKDVRAVLRPFQRPYPPLWYPTNYPASIPWIGQHNLSTMFGSLFPSLEATREQFAIYHQQRAAHHDDPDRLNAHVPDPCYGIVRHVYVADSDAQAEQDARAAYAQWYESFGHLWVIHHDPRLLRRGTWEEFVAQGGIYYGAPATVRAQVQDALRRSGANYFVGAFAFGNLTADQSRRSLRLFADQVIPACRTVADP
jgi:alkanesulfonate monooxygenase SsuD/methylene tetrahydromethanopterin reductase-like flavin-dependent oxidoreductase (luciferase family)